MSAVIKMIRSFIFKQNERTYHFSFDLRQKVLRCLDKCLSLRRANHSYVSFFKSSH